MCSSDLWATQFVPEVQRTALESRRKSPLALVDELIRDANNYDRTDVRYPFLRSFDAYAGHSWESGHGDFGDGNNEESSSESMNFSAAVMLWGAATHRTEVRYLGISGTIPNLKDQIAMGVFDVFQIPYSALQLEHEALMSEAAATGAGIVIRGGAARGGPEKEAGDAWARWNAANLDELLQGMTRMEFVLRFTYTNPDLDTTIVGTLNLDHLQSNIDALLKGPLPSDVYQEAHQRLAALSA